MKTLSILFCLLFVQLPALFSQPQERYPLRDYDELTDTKPFDSPEVWEKRLASPVRFAWGSVDVRYPKRSVPVVTQKNRWQEKAWKGERVHAQALVSTRTDLEGATLAVSDLKSGSSVIPSSAIDANFVRYVLADIVSKGKSACGYRTDKAEWDSMLVADVIDSAGPRNIRAYTNQPVWLNIWVPQDAKAGRYTGTLTLSGSNFKSLTLPIEVTVLNRTLPAPEKWAFHLDLWQNPYAVARYYQVPLWSREHFDAMRPLMKKLAGAGQKMITATIMHKPWNGQTEDPFDSMIGKMKLLNGTWAYDYTVFDKWVEFMMNDVGIDGYISCYTMIPWNLQFEYYNQATSRVEYIRAKPGDVAYGDYWGAFLKDFAKHLKSKGWFERTIISMDERGLEHMKEAIRVIRSADPDYKISLAGNYHGEIEHELFDLSIAYGQTFPEEVKARREQEGKISTVYTCCAEALPNMFLGSPLAETPWTIWHSLAGNYDGYLRWAYNSWVQEPLLDGRFRTWAAGDCFIVYPGFRSSIRMERLIEGIQDAEKVRILRKEFAEKGEKANLERLNRAIEPFVHENLTPGNAGEMVGAARETLNSFR